MTNRSLSKQRLTHADKSSDDTSRYLRVSIATEVTTCDSPPRFSSISNRSPSDLIWSTPFSPPSHSATVLIRGRIFLGREPKLATLVETFHPSGLREPKFVSIPAEPASAFRRSRNCNAARDINLVFCAPLRRASTVYRGVGPILRHRFRDSCFATSTDLPGNLVDQVEIHQTNICNPPILFSKTSRLRHLRTTNRSRSFDQDLSAAESRMFRDNGLAQRASTT